MYLQQWSSQEGMKTKPLPTPSTDVKRMRVNCPHHCPHHLTQVNFQSLPAECSCGLPLQVPPREPRNVSRLDNWASPKIIIAGAEHCGVCRVAQKHLPDPQVRYQCLHSLDPCSCRVPNPSLPLPVDAVAPVRSPARRPLRRSCDKG